jgi:signal transduction histidine kinase
MQANQSAAVRTGFWARLGDAASRAGQWAWPHIRRWARVVSDWLATVGWGKFLLLSLLALAFGGILSNALIDRKAAVIIDTAPQEVKVDVIITPEGIRVGAPKGAKRADAGAKNAGTPAAPGEARVSIEDTGVRIRTEDGGRQVSIVIDGRGVRFEEASPESVPGEVKVDLPVGAGVDAAATAEAIEAARAKIESIVEEQVSRQVARKVQRYSAETSDWVVSFIFLLIVAGVIVKLALGGRQKAEKRAALASATAAEEGLKRQLAEAELKMMQAQVEPHFLFNTLASVDYLIETDPPRASQMQKNLIAYLRAALPEMREGSTTLGKEVALCRAYLEILRVRMDERLQTAINVPQGLLNAQFPPMMLQSLVENSIKHGLEPKPEGGSVTISADVANGRLRVRVADTGLGFTHGAASGVGLSNIRERLKQLYGGDASFVVEANAHGGTIATIEVPYRWDAGTTAAKPAAA